MAVEEELILEGRSDATVHHSAWPGVACAAVAAVAIRGVREEPCAVALGHHNVRHLSSAAQQIRQVRRQAGGFSTAS